MKKLISVILCLVLMLTLAACNGSSATKMTMGTDGTSGTYYAFGGVLGQYTTAKKAAINLPLQNPQLLRSWG